MIHTRADAERPRGGEAEKTGKMLPGKWPIPGDWKDCQRADPTGAVQFVRAMAGTKMERRTKERRKIPKEMPRLGSGQRKDPLFGTLEKGRNHRLIPQQEETITKLIQFPFTKKAVEKSRERMMRRPIYE